LAEGVTVVFNRNVEKVFFNYFFFTHFSLNGLITVFNIAVVFIGSMLGVGVRDGRWSIQRSGRPNGLHPVRAQGIGGARSGRVKNKKLCFAKIFIFDAAEPPQSPVFCGAKNAPKKCCAYRIRI
jgi:hypothetical protein